MERKSKFCCLVVRPEFPTAVTMKLSMSSTYHPLGHDAVQSAANSLFVTTILQSAKTSDKSLLKKSKKVKLSL
jgi:hypothetical protein